MENITEETKSQFILDVERLIAADKQAAEQIREFCKRFGLTPPPKQSDKPIMTVAERLGLQ